VTEIAREGERIVGRGEDGALQTFSGAEVASMNLWGVSPNTLRALEAQFERFLRRSATDPRAEFLVSAAVNEQVRRDRRRVAVLRAESEWFGMTFAADVDGVRRRLAELTAAGYYPRDLREGRD
jgi:flavin-dependent dehydrogenase